MGVCKMYFLDFGVDMNKRCNLCIDFVKPVFRVINYHWRNQPVKLSYYYDRLKILFHNKYLLINKQNFVIKLLFWWCRFVIIANRKINLAIDFAKSALRKYVIVIKNNRSV